MKKMVLLFFSLIVFSETMQCAQADAEQETAFEKAYDNIVNPLRNEILRKYRDSGKIEAIRTFFSNPLNGKVLTDFLERMREAHKENISEETLVFSAGNSLVLGLFEHSDSMRFKSIIEDAIRNRLAYEKIVEEMGPEIFDTIFDKVLQKETGKIALDYMKEAEKEAQFERITEQVSNDIIDDFCAPIINEAAKEMAMYLKMRTVIDAIIKEVAEEEYAELQRAKEALRQEEQLKQVGLQREYSGPQAAADRRCPSGDHPHGTACACAAFQGEEAHRPRLQAAKKLELRDHEFPCNYCGNILPIEREKNGTLRVLLCPCQTKNQIDFERYRKIVFQGKEFAKVPLSKIIELQLRYPQEYKVWEDQQRRDDERRRQNGYQERVEYLDTFLQQAGIDLTGMSNEEKEKLARALQLSIAQDSERLAAENEKRLREEEAQEMKRVLAESKAEADAREQEEQRQYAQDLEKALALSMMQEE